MRLLVDAEHTELARVPTAYDVETEAAGTDLIDGRHLLGGEDGVHHGRMHCAEHRESARYAEDTAGPAQGLE